MMWYEILSLCVVFALLVAFVIFVMVMSYKEEIKIQELRKAQIKFYNTIVEVYSDVKEKY